MEYALVAGFAILAVLLNAARVVRWWRVRRFEKIFGFKPGRGLHEIFFRQSLVDRTLGELALAFSLACKRQIALRCLTADTKEDVVKLDNEFSFVDVSVALAKRDFWKAHGLARYFKMKVRKSYTDYLAPSSIK